MQKHSILIVKSLVQALYPKLDPHISTDNGNDQWPHSMYVSTV